MQRLSESQRDWLRQATVRYHQALSGSPAEEYLASRGLALLDQPFQGTLDQFRLGYVAEPLPGHEGYRGMLAIPYIRYSQEYGWGVVSIRFRKLVADADNKYLTVAGDRPRLYNTTALLRRSPYVAITEGELDAITAELCGVPTVGVPGSQVWRPHHVEPFRGYRDVYVLADGDEAGREFATKVKGSLVNGKVIPMPERQDVNSVVVQGGPDALLRRLR
jgi:DNA primase